MCMVNVGYTRRTMQKRKTVKRKARRKQSPLGREAWLDTARMALIEEGTAGVEINKLAKRLGVSRGGFYWFFEHREQLLDELLVSWADTGVQLFERVLLGAPERDGMKEYLALIHLWIDEKDYDPKWDGAVRDWARTSANVLQTVQAVDDKRIRIIERIFNNLGYDGMEAHIRARVTYYHQVGYYALGVREPRRKRLELIPYYAKVLTDRDV
jgi:AcrR family transcriptional regulator